MFNFLFKWSKSFKDHNHNQIKNIVLSQPKCSPQFKAFGKSYIKSYMLKYNMQLLT